MAQEENNYLNDIGLKSLILNIKSGFAQLIHTHKLEDIENLQNILDEKSSYEHTHNYAGSSSVGGTANSCCGFKIQKSAVKPSNPDNSTIYIIIEE